MRKNHWVVVMGYPGSGKTTVAGILRGKGVVAFELFDYFRGVIKLEGASRDAITEKVKQRIEAQGRVCVISDVVSWVEGQTDPGYAGPIFVVGARNSEDVGILKSMRPVTFCVMVRCVPDKRMMNIITRAKAIDKDIIRAISSNAKSETDTELIDCIREHTNYLIDNCGTLAHLEGQVDALLTSLEA